ncbi:UNVERIFIED_CONTAM: hypothetical protein Slati_4489600 [Sesamum latifolium]|uniref:Uncharacterized protein n=1 Tax=Sesamum latifolium TaxID=2727402 RepID=A0AAW2SS34_9LAMI
MSSPDSLALISIEEGGRCLWLEGPEWPRLAMDASIGFLVEASASTGGMLGASVPVGRVEAVNLGSLNRGFLLAPLLFPRERVCRAVPLYPLLMPQILLFWTGKTIVSL